MEFTARVRDEEGAYWAEVAELPGCFASGRTLDELSDALGESVRLYLNDGGSPPSDGHLRIAELKLST